MNNSTSSQFIDQKLIYSIYDDAFKLNSLKAKKRNLFLEKQQTKSSNVFIGLFSQIALAFNVIRITISEKITVCILTFKTKKLDTYFKTELSKNQIGSDEFFFEVARKCHEIALKTILKTPSNYSFKQKDLFCKSGFYSGRINHIDLNWLVFSKYKNSPVPSAMLMHLLKKAKIYGKEDIDKGELEAAIKSASNEYKIHLMPKPEHFESVVNKLTETIDKNPDLEKVLMSFKFLKNPKLIKQNGQYVPLIVLYIDPDSDFEDNIEISAKKNAQIALDILIKEFADVSEINGSNKTPRYNQKVNSLIYYSQGDSVCKHLAKEAKMFSTIFDKNGIHFQGKDHSLKVK